MVGEVNCSKKDRQSCYSLFTWEVLEQMQFKRFSIFIFFHLSFVEKFSFAKCQNKFIILFSLCFILLSIFYLFLVSVQWKIFHLSLCIHWDCFAVSLSSFFRNLSAFSSYLLVHIWLKKTIVILIFALSFLHECL